MMQETFPETWADTMALLCSIPVFTFTLIYGVRVKWYKSLLGVALLSLFASFSSLFILIIIRRFVGDFDGYQTIAAFVYSFLLLSFSFFLAIFIVERRRGKETLPVPIGRIITGEIRTIKEVPMSNLDPKDYKNGQKVTRDASGQLVTADPQTGQPTNVPAPKVLAAGATMGLLIVAVAVLGAITPEMLSFAGQWSALIYAAVVAAGGFLAGYIKRP